jgi:HPt (histidine-containing phosphotransfer) domain-containing protein
VAAPADDDHAGGAPRTIDMRVPESKRDDNVETASRKTLELAHSLATRLTAVAGDARAIEANSTGCCRRSPTRRICSTASRSSAPRCAPLNCSRKSRKPAAAKRQRSWRNCWRRRVPPKRRRPVLPLPSSQAAEDSELRDIFVEEAREVLDSIVDNLQALGNQRGDQATMTTVRRAFHTLKGSSRMVGFKTVGEGAWAVEQCFNLWLAQERQASDDLLQLA